MITQRRFFSSSKVKEIVDIIIIKSPFTSVHYLPPTLLLSISRVHSILPYVMNSEFCCVNIEYMFIMRYFIR